MNTQLGLLLASSLMAMLVLARAAQRPRSRGARVDRRTLIRQCAARGMAPKRISQETRLPEDVVGLALHSRTAAPTAQRKNVPTREATSPRRPSRVNSAPRRLSVTV